MGHLKWSIGHRKRLRGDVDPFDCGENVVVAGDGVVVVDIVGYSIVVQRPIVPLKMSSSSPRLVP